MSTEFNNIKTNVTDISTEFNNIQTNVTDMSTEFYNIKTNVTDMSTEFNNIKTDLTDMSTDIRSNTRTIMNVTTEFNNIQTNVTDISTEFNNIKTNVTDMSTEFNNIKTDLTPLKGYINTCAYQYSTTSKSQTITYGRLLLNSTNLYDGGMNYGTGIFTAPTTGDYLVTYSLYADNDVGNNNVRIYMKKNNGIIGESEHLSRYSGSSGKSFDQGGRSLILHLSKGETTSLYCQDCSAYVFVITFCVSLTTPTSG